MILGDHTKGPSVRLSSIRHLNDKNEFWHYIKFAHDHLEAIEGLSATQQAQIKNGLMEFWKQPELTSLPFINSYCFCMSTESDDLSQWRGYGDDGYGVSIGFDKRQFGFPYPEIGLHEVMYTENDHLQELQKIQVGAMTVALKEGISSDLTQAHENLIGRLVRILIDSVASSCKAEHFASENEWRLIYTPKLNASAQDSALLRLLTTPIPKEHITFQVMLRGKTVVPCYDFTIPKTSIRKIRLGPNVTDLSKMGLKLLLEQRYFEHVELINSDIGYRSRW